MIVNSVAIETPYGFREFILEKGDILDVETELMIISSHTFKGRVDGVIISEIEKLIGEKFYNEMKRIINQEKNDFFQDDITEIKREKYVNSPAIYYKETQLKSFPDLLLARIHSPQLFYSIEDALISYESSINAIFASLSVLEFDGKNYKKISMPVLGGARKFPKGDIISIILKKAIHWLTYSRYTSKIIFVVNEQDEVNQWNEAMNLVLGRSFEEIGSKNSIRELQIEIRNIIRRNESRILNKDLSDVLESLDNELGNKKLYIQQFGMFGRKIAEIISKEICRDLNIKPSDNPYSNIEKIESTNKIAKWINSYLHNLRVLGNEAVHVIENDYRVPEKLTQSDLLVIFSNIIRILEFYLMWKDSFKINNDKLVD